MLWIIGIVIAVSVIYFVKGAVSQKPLYEITDFLGKRFTDPKVTVTLEDHLISDSTKTAKTGKRYLVTGGSGFLGTCLSKCFVHTIRKPHRWSSDWARRTKHHCFWYSSFTIVCEWSKSKVYSRRSQKERRSSKSLSRLLNNSFHWHLRNWYGVPCCCSCSVHCKIQIQLQTKLRNQLFGN